MYVVQLRSPLDALGELAEHTHREIPNWRARADVSPRWERLLAAGVLVRFLDGQDYYNIRFAERRTGIVIGAVLDPSAREDVR